MLANGVETNVYRGLTSPSTISRELYECETSWNSGELRPGKFDQFLATQLELAAAQGRSTVNVLDLGCGTGALIKNIVNDKIDEDRQRIAASRRILSANPGLRIRIIGLTDAPSDGKYLKSEAVVPSPYVVPLPTNDQINAEIVYFSITANQTIGQFAEATGLDNIDLVVSTGFLLYLGDMDVYKKTIQDVAKRLRPSGGRFLGADYAGWISPEAASREQVEELMQKLNATDNPIESAAKKIKELVKKAEKLEKQRRAFIREFSKEPGLDVKYDEHVFVVTK